MGSSATGSHGTVSIGTSAAVISTGKTLRRSLTIRNRHATNKLYVGTSSAVTTATGFPVDPGEALELTDYVGAVYGIADGASTDVRYLDVS